MIIEIIGLPGSGKSTVAREISKFRNWQVVSFEGKREILRFFISGLSKNPKVFLLGFFDAIKYAQTVSSFWNCYFVKYAKHQKALSLKSINFVINEGLHQNLFSYSKRKFNKKYVRNFLKRKMMVDMLFLINVDEKVLAERQLERELSRDKRVFSKDEYSNMRLVKEYLLHQGSEIEDFYIVNDNINSILSITELQDKE